jgi:NAD+ synthase
MANSSTGANEPNVEPPRLEAPADTRRSVERFVQSVVADAGADGVVVNLSGGIDSSVTATIAVEALGSSRVTGLVLPAGPTPTDDVDDAIHLAEELVVDYRIIDVEPVVERCAALLHDDGGVVGTDTDRDETRTERDRQLALGNLAARVRMALAYFHANLAGRLVLGTGNRTELELGYFTKYGDGGVDALPLGGLYKTQVRDLASALDVPDRIVEKPPTAGLWEGQTDEGELGASYTVIDAILRELIERGQTVSGTATRLELDRSLVERIATSVSASHHKRNMPPIPSEY